MKSFKLNSMQKSVVYAELNMELRMGLIYFSEIQQYRRTNSQQGERAACNIG
jgi:hypothetical protein